MLFPIYNDVDNFVIIDDIDILDRMITSFKKLRDVVFFKKDRSEERRVGKEC